MIIDSWRALNTALCIDKRFYKTVHNFKTREAHHYYQWTNAVFSFQKSQSFLWMPYYYEKI